MKVKQRIKIIALSQGGESKVPEWICILPAGQPETMDGFALVVDQAAVDSVLAYFDSHGVDLVVDYEHQTQEGVEAPAAGWIKELKAAPQGIMARVEWTERASAYIAAREYRYLSPVVLYEKNTYRVRAITDVALTNSPRLNNFPAIINKAGGDDMDLLAKLKALFRLAEDANEETAFKAAEKLANSFKAALKSLAGLAGLDEKAEADTVLEAVQNKLQAAGAKQDGLAVLPGSVTAALGLADGAAEGEVLGAIKGLKQGSTTLEQLQNKLATLEAKTAEDQAEKLVSKALDDGKIAPAQKDWALGYAKSDPKGFSAYVNSAPKVVPTGKLPGGEPAPAPGGGDGLQQQMNSMLGVSAEDFEKYGPKEKDAA